ncbi:MAG: folate-binding protein [Kocuria sp.]|nr:folate-binding protein [Kocuria sp.]
MATATYRSVLLDTAHGAVEAVGRDAGVAAHYGDPLREQRSLIRGQAVVDLSHFGVLTVEGPDRLSWLTTLSSQVLTNLDPGDSAETLFLSVQGRVEFAPHVVDDGTRSWLIVEAHELQPLHEWLDRMRFALRVEVVDRSNDVAVVGAVQVPEHVEAASARLAADHKGQLSASTDSGAPLVWVDPWPGVVHGGWAYSSTPDHPAQHYSWHQVLVARDDLTEIFAGPAADGLALSGIWAAEALRIEAWRPRAGTEVDDRTVPHELDWLRTAVHLEKGCYKGQETVARVHNLGHPPRRLTFLDVDGSEHTVPPAGAEVVLDGRVVGRVTAAQLHHEAGPIALAVIKRAVDPTAQLTVRVPRSDVEPIEDHAAEQWAATQIVVVPPDAGQTVQRPKGFLRGPR